jgi:hypothetical protein
VTSMPGSFRSIGRARSIRAVRSASGENRFEERDGGLRYANPPYEFRKQRRRISSASQNRPLPGRWRARRPWCPGSRSSGR